MLGLEDGDFTGEDGAFTGFDARTPFARITTDAAGRFSLEDVGAGAWGLAACGEGLPEAQLLFEIAERQGTRELDLELARGLSIQGIVLDPEGRLARGASVSCSGQDSRLEHFRCSDWTEGDGAFALGPLLAGLYWVSARPDDPLHAISERVPARAGESGVVVRLRWGSVLSGSVVDANTGEPAEAVVWGAGGYGHVPAEVFEFGHVLPGVHDIRARTADGRVGVLAGVPVREGERKSGLVVAVGPGARVSLRTGAPEGTIFKTEVDWEGILMSSAWGDPEPFAVPPGEIAIRWFRVDRQGERTLEHQESRRVHSASEELVVEHEMP
jgi:hypothetical protein